MGRKERRIAIVQGGGGGGGGRGRAGEKESWYEVGRDGGTTRPADPRRPDVDRRGQAERNGPWWINYH